MYNGLPTKSYRTYEIEDKAHPYGQVRVALKANRRSLKCPYCEGGRLRSKGIYRRRARHLPVFGRESRVKVSTKRYRCLDCCRSFVPPMPGILPRRHCTEPLRQQIAKDHHSGICGAVLAEIFKLGSATIERIYTEFNRRKAAERESLQSPIVLGIDEHTLHKKQRFATTFCDLKKYHKVFDVAPGKNAKDLEPFLARLKGRERVKVVCIDLSSIYRSIIRKWFSNARIVADRFHVVRVIQHHFITLCRETMGENADKRKASALMRTNPHKLNASQRLRLSELFLQFPAIEPLYKEMHRLRRLIGIKSRTKRQCRPLAKALHRCIKRLKQSLFKPLETLAKTLQTWLEPIACMWRFTKNNGITEGFHRKMKLIQRPRLRLQKLPKLSTQSHRSLRMMLKSILNH